MNLNLILPISAAVILLLAIVVRDGIKSPDAKKLEAPAGIFLILAVLVGVLMVGLTLTKGVLPNAVSAGYGMGIGICGAALAYACGLLKGQSEAGRAAPLALATLIVSVLPWFPQSPPAVAVLFGAAVGAWVLSIGKLEDPNPWAMRVAVFMAAIIAANQIGSAPGLTPEAAHAGTIFGAIASLIGVIVAAGPAPARGIGACILFAAAAFVAGDRLFQAPAAVLVVAGGGICALVVSWLIDDDIEPNTLRMALATVIWIAAGTAAFSNGAGFSMSLLFLAAVAVLLILGNRRALLTLGPLGAIVFYRLFRVEHIEATKALDIGQHYAMIGMVIGAILPVMAQEWLRTVSKRGGIASIAAGMAWIVTLFGVPICAAIMFGAKGVVGYLFGLGLASVIEGIRGERSAHALSLGLGLSGVMTLVFESLQPHLEMARDEKSKALLYIGSGIAVAVIVIAVLSGELVRSKEQPQA
ncbi:MAG: hypothetical protein ABL949_14550 [Fimbriimonadaceae bacterium]